MQWRNWVTYGRDWILRQDLMVLVFMFLAAITVWGYIEIADEISQGEVHAMDEKIILAFRNPADPGTALGPLWFADAVRDITALGSVVIVALVTLAVAGYIAMRRQYLALSFLLISVCGGGLLSLLLKQLFGRPRPELVPHLTHAGGASFPSGHSLTSAVVYLTLGALLARMVKPMKFKLYIIALALFLSFLVGLSRVYLGVHYPTDVLAGWAVGLVWAIGCWLVIRFLQRRGSIERPSEPAPEQRHGDS